MRVSHEGGGVAERRGAGCRFGTTAAAASSRDGDERVLRRAGASRGVRLVEITFNGREYAEGETRFRVVPPLGARRRDPRGDAGVGAGGVVFGVGDVGAGLQVRPASRYAAGTGSSCSASTTPTTRRTTRHRTPTPTPTRRRATRRFGEAPAASSRRWFPRLPPLAPRERGSARSPRRRRVRVRVRASAVAVDAAAAMVTGAAALEHLVVSVFAPPRTDALDPPLGPRLGATTVFATGRDFLRGGGAVDDARVSSTFFRAHRRRRKRFGRIDRRAARARREQCARDVRDPSPRRCGVARRRRRRARRRRRGARASASTAANPSFVPTSDNSEKPLRRRRLDGVDPRGDPRFRSCSMGSPSARPRHRPRHRRVTHPRVVPLRRGRPGGGHGAAGRRRRRRRRRGDARACARARHARAPPRASGPPRTGGTARAATDDPVFATDASDASTHYSVIDFVTAARPAFAFPPPPPRSAAALRRRSRDRRHVGRPGTGAGDGRRRRNRVRVRRRRRRRRARRICAGTKKNTRRVLPRVGPVHGGLLPAAFFLDSANERNGSLKKVALVSDPKYQTQISFGVRRARARARARADQAAHAGGGAVVSSPARTCAATSTARWCARWRPARARRRSPRRFPSPSPSPRRSSRARRRRRFRRARTRRASRSPAPDAFGVPARAVIIAAYSWRRRRRRSATCRRCR